MSLLGEMNNDQNQLLICKLRKLQIPLCQGVVMEPYNLISKCFEAVHMDSEKHKPISKSQCKPSLLGKIEHLTKFQSIMGKRTRKPIQMA